MKKQVNDVLAETREILLEKLTYKDVESLMINSDGRLEILPEKTLKEMRSYHDRVIDDPAYTEEARTVAHAIYKAYTAGELYVRMSIEAIGIVKSWTGSIAKKALEG